MSEPFPNPALMLPAIDLSGPPDLDHHLNYKKREAQWKRLVSETHKQWCLCGSFINHFILPKEPLKCGEEEENIGDEKDDGLVAEATNGDADIDGDPDEG
nr:ORF2 [Torque teno felis virus]